MDAESLTLVCVEESVVSSGDRRIGETHSTSRLGWAVCANARESNPRYAVPAAKTATIVVPDEWQTFCHGPFMRVTST